MTKIFKLENLDCANCAAKMERNIKGIDGVNDCTVSFMTQKMNVEFVEDADEMAVMKAVVKAKPAAAKGQYIRSCTVVSTMGPGVKVNTTKYA